jgi:YbgC/YbaW family acyl-CoA thioester hydrolase
MARIHLDLPDQFIFSAELTVRVSDLNYGGHVGNDTMLTLIQEARVLFYRSLGFANVTQFDGDVGQIIADAAVQYKSESFLGDVLLIEITVRDLTRFGFDMVYRVSERHSGREVARAKTGIVCFDYARRKVAPIPEALMTKLNSPT